MASTVLLALDYDYRKSPGPHGVEIGGSIRIITRRHWFRVGAYLGEAPGSHMGLWHTDTGTVHGWNYRIGSLRRCLTLLAHTRPSLVELIPAAHD